jgi:O-antigen/teichoic acid export membrane protein
MFPTLSSVQDEKERLKALLRRSMTTSALIILPAALGITAVAENLVLVLFGEQWAESIPFMQIISIAEAHIAITSANLITIKATGRSDIYMKLEIVRRISMIGILLISILCFNSVKAIAIGYAISAWIDVIIVTVPMKKIVGYGLLSQLKDVWKIAFAAVLMGALVMFLGKILIIPMILKLITQVIFGGIIYFLLCLVLRIESFNYILGILKKYFLRRSK